MSGIKPSRVNNIPGLVAFFINFFVCVGIEFNSTKSLLIG